MSRAPTEPLPDSAAATDVAAPYCWLFLFEILVSEADFNAPVPSDVSPSVLTPLIQTEETNGRRTYSTATICFLLSHRQSGREETNNM